MKYYFQSIFTTIILLTLGTPTCAQTWFQEGDYWLYAYSNGISGTDGYCEMIINGDTIINNIQLKKLKINCLSYSLASNNYYENQFYKYAYEEDRKVFLSNDNNDIAEALDFNELIDSTYEYNRSFFSMCQDNVDLQLDSTGTFELDNENLQIQYFSVYDSLWNFTFKNTFYERIGALQGRILIPDIPCYTDGDGYRLCQFKTETDSLSFLDEDCFDITVKVKNLFQDKINLHPNPASTNITVDYSSTPSTLTIYDLQGQFIKKIEDSQQVNIEQLTTGIYFLHIRIEDRLVVKKFIKH